MKSGFTSFVDRLRLAPWLWALLVVATAVIVIVTNALAVILSLVIWVLALNGLYHVLLALRTFFVRTRTIVSTFLLG